MPFQGAEVGCSGVYRWWGWKCLRCFHACFGFLAAAGISVQQVEICAVLVTCVHTAKAPRDTGAV